MFDTASKIGTHCRPAAYHTPWRPPWRPLWLPLWQRCRGGLAALAIAALIPFSAGAQQDPAAHAAAKQVVEGFYRTLIEVMREAATLGYAGRYGKLAPAIADVYDLPAMAKAALGGDRRYWGRLDESQRRAMVDAFTAMSVSTYANRFDGYNGENLEVLNSQDGPRGTILVRSRIVKSSGEAVRLDYLMKKRPGGWKIVDVFAKGSISEIATKRSDYGAIIKKRGFDGLISAIKAKVASFGKS